MTQHLVIDCTPLTDALGRSVIPSGALVDYNAGEETARSNEIIALAAVAPVQGMTMAAGRVTLGLIDGVSKAVIFAKAMRTADYVVTLNPETSMSVGLWATNKTPTGFTLNMSGAVNGTIDYIAQEVT